MATIRHKKLAKNIRKCRTMKDAMIKSEYAESYADSGAINQTKGWQEEKKSILEQYQKEEQRLLVAAESKDLSKEEYKVIIDSLDKIRKQIQLLSGGMTERKELVFSDEQSRKIAREILDDNTASEKKAD